MKPRLSSLAPPCSDDSRGGGDDLEDAMTTITAPVTLEELTIDRDGAPGAYFVREPSACTR